MVDCQADLKQLHYKDEMSFQNVALMSKQDLSPT
jgi:hypothetical protein